ncbi:MAG TPA: diguanylate cyclase [Thermoanaerobaculia bacterium]|nr:diguanylate cyclase [Thermoanaerobaculia bacterium]
MTDDAPLRAMIVDDHESERVLIAELLSDCGFEVTACAGGAEVLAVIRQDAVFDLLVIDCEMPLISGLGLITALRAQKETADAYAVMLSARNDSETRLSALRLGFDDYISKSVGRDEVEARLRAVRRVLLRQHQLDETVRELYSLSTRDELTGVLNRRGFLLQTERLLAENKIVNLIFFDLDDFKKINDTLGHLAGDRILRDIGSLFLRRTRHEDLIARYGGDEFVMLVLHLAPAEVEALAARIAEDIAAQQWNFGAETYRIGVTTGIACSSLLDRPTIAQLLSAGDRDLYKNKWLRRNPDTDLSLYSYDASRDARVLELLTARPAKA